AQYDVPDLREHFARGLVEAPGERDVVVRHQPRERGGLIVLDEQDGVARDGSAEDLVHRGQIAVAQGEQTLLHLLDGAQPQPRRLHHDAPSRELRKRARGAVQHHVEQLREGVAVDGLEVHNCAPPRGSGHSDALADSRSSPRTGLAMNPVAPAPLISSAVLRCTSALTTMTQASGRMWRIWRSTS